MGGREKVEASENKTDKKSKKHNIERKKELILRVLLVQIGKMTP